MPGPQLQDSGPWKVPLASPNKAPLEPTMPPGERSIVCPPKDRPIPRTRKTGLEILVCTGQVAPGRGCPPARERRRHKGIRPLASPLVRARAPAILSPWAAICPTGPETADQKARNRLQCRPGPPGLRRLLECTAQRSCPSPARRQRPRGR